MNLANKITVLRILMIPVFMLFMLLEFPFHMEAALLVFLAASLTDKLDGHIARKFNMITDFGKFMDPLADKLLITGALVVLIQLGRIEAWIVFVILTREFAVTGLRSLAAAQSIIIAAGKYGKIKTVVQIISIAILILDNFPFSLINIPMDIIMIYIMLIITVLSGIDYFNKNMQVILKMK
ncbi:MAG TPA: CDP-diacylglycerol--glycerol-3-phosphate 3-phosphatidyltransferase [Bacillota bacterium]|nr:CDP-diacylglycerol--glycerol-3-phosphate 3-phosphatidyltransferase [Bacillota bacterium]HOR85667.1 CDP-diacylglycerol--glycerol-3-phosphate 3-phosphatidyltransferase [Bacillota bacterium]HPL52982.1 CDP-diacylglycerol--glycerol-3-phosphate 3-phosphatidyltransferase [Bacillota bacterium]